MNGLPRDCLRALLPFLAEPHHVLRVWKQAHPLSDAVFTQTQTNWYRTNVLEPLGKESLHFLPALDSSLLFQHLEIITAPPQDAAQRIRLFRARWKRVLVHVDAFKTYNRVQISSREVLRDVAFACVVLHIPDSNGWGAESATRWLWEQTRQPLLGGCVPELSLTGPDSPD